MPSGHGVLRCMPLVVLIACAPRTPAPVAPLHPSGAQPPYNCPTLSASDTATTAVAAATPDIPPSLDKLRVWGRYLSILIDDQRELWNQDLDNWTSDLAPGLKPSDIQSISFWRPGTAPATYHVCPGVSAITIVTKSKTYHPSRTDGP